MRRRSSQASVLRAVETIEQIAARVVEQLRPRPRIGTVVSVDTGTWTCAVTIDGAQQTVKIGSLIPDGTGMKVRVEGVEGDRYISAVLGPCTLRDS